MPPPPSVEERDRGSASSLLGAGANKVLGHQRPCCAKLTGLGLEGSQGTWSAALQAARQEGIARPTQKPPQKKLVEAGAKAENWKLSARLTRGWQPVQQAVSAFARWGGPSRCPPWRAPWKDPGRQCLQVLPVFSEPFLRTGLVGIRLQRRLSAKRQVVACHPALTQCLECQSPLRCSPRALVGSIRQVSMAPSNPLQLHREELPNAFAEASASANIAQRFVPAHHAARGLCGAAERPAAAKRKPEGLQAAFPSAPRSCRTTAWSR